MKNKNESIGASLGKAINEFCRFLTILFCTLRACDVITWKWHWIISPLIFCEVVGIIAIMIAGLLALAVVTKD